MDRATFEEHIKKSILVGQCPACGHAVRVSDDNTSGDKLVICGGCGWTRRIL